jgi:hypothetical protein
MQAGEACDATRAEVRTRRRYELLAWHRKISGRLPSAATSTRTSASTKPAQHNMSDTEMDGGVALGGASPTHSQLAERINSGAMDVKSPALNGAASTADSTMSGRLYGLPHRWPPVAS